MSSLAQVTKKSWDPKQRNYWRSSVCVLFRSSIKERFFFYIPLSFLSSSYFIQTFLTFFFSVAHGFRFLIGVSLNLPAETLSATCNLYYVFKGQFKCNRKHVMWTFTRKYKTLAPVTYIIVFHRRVCWENKRKTHHSHFLLFSFYSLIFPCKINQHINQTEKQLWMYK